MKTHIVTMFWLIALVSFALAGEEKESNDETQSVLQIVSIAVPQSDGST